MHRNSAARTHSKHRRSGGELGAGISTCMLRAASSLTTLSSSGTPAITACADTPSAGTPNATAPLLSKYNSTAALISPFVILARKPPAVRRFQIRANTHGIHADLNRFAACSSESSSPRIILSDATASASCASGRASARQHNVYQAAVAASAATCGDDKLEQTGQEDRSRQHARAWCRKQARHGRVGSTRRRGRGRGRGSFAFASVQPTVVVPFLDMLARLCRPALKITGQINPQLTIGRTARVQAQRLAAVQLRHLRPLSSQVGQSFDTVRDTDLFWSGRSGERNKR